MGSTVGPEGNLLDPRPESCRQIKIKYPVIDNAQLAKLRHVYEPGFKAITLPMLFDPRQGGPGLEHAMDQLKRQASAAVQAGYTILILSDRGADRERAPIPSLLATAGVHHHLVRQGTRTRCGLVHRNRRRARSASLRAAARLRRGRRQSVPGVRDARRHDPARTAHRRDARGGGRALHPRAQQGHPEGDVQDGHLDAAELLRRADLRGRRSRPGVRRQVLHLDGVARRRRRHRRHRRRSDRAASSRLPGPAGRPARARVGRRVPVATRRRDAPVQPGHGVQAAARDAQRAVHDLQGIHEARRRSEQAARDAARPAAAAPGRRADSARRGRAGRAHHQALRDRRDVVRIDQPGSARDARDRDEPPRRQIEHRRGRRGSGALHARRQRRLAPKRDQAGRVRAVRRHERIPRQRRRSADQDGAGRQARRGRPAARATRSTRGSRRCAIRRPASA